MCIRDRDGKLKDAVILSKAGEPCNLRYGNLTFTFKTTKGKTYNCLLYTSLRLLITEAASPTMIQCLYSLWETERVQQLNARDYTTLAYELALRIPEQGKEILQRCV